MSSLADVLPAPLPPSRRVTIHPSRIPTSMLPKAGNFCGGAEVKPPGKGGTPPTRGSPGDRHGEERQGESPGDKLALLPPVSTVHCRRTLIPQTTRSTRAAQDAPHRSICGAVEDVVRMVLPHGADQQGNLIDLPGVEQRLLGLPGLSGRAAALDPSCPACVGGP